MCDFCHLNIFPLFLENWGEWQFIDNDGKKYHIMVFDEVEEQGEQVCRGKCAITHEYQLLFKGQITLIDIGWILDRDWEPVYLSLHPDPANVQGFNKL